MTISHRGSSATFLQALCPFRGTIASAYKPDDHYGVINFDEHVIRAGQEVKGASDGTCWKGHVAKVAAHRGEDRPIKVLWN